MKRYCLILLTLLILISCTDKETSSATESKDLALPDISLKDASFTLGQSGENPLFISGESIEFYMSEDKVYVNNISFTQLDDDGNLFISGSAGYGIINTENKRSDLSKGVNLIQHRDELEISAESLVFDAEKQTVDSPKEVNISFGDGSLKGSNLSADLKSSTFELMSIEDGELVL